MDSATTPSRVTKSTTPTHRSLLLGLLVRKERWSLSWKGWALAFTLFCGLSSILLLKIYPFLALSDRIETETMVVEGWMDQTDLAQAVEEFKRGHYRRVFTTGGPVHGAESNMSDYSTSAHIAARALVALGLSADIVQSVPSHVRDRDRTYSSAVALRNWLRAHHQNVQSLVIVTEGVHARRSRLLFEKAFGEGTSIGVIALKNVDYDGNHWWRYSEGVKDVLGEVVGYLYARVFFHPPRQS